MCKVSVLMPVYNAEKYLEEAIDSIISQTFTDWELLIINDGSTDSSKSIIESYTDSRIRYIENERNIGLIKTLNKGVNLCNGKYIARMDSDDTAHPQRLFLQVVFLDKNSDYIMCGTNARVIDTKGEVIGKITNPSSNILLQISLLFTNPFVHPSMMIRKRALTNNKFDERALHVEDYELWIRLANEGKIANVSESLLSYRWHDTNISVQHSSIQEKAKNTIIQIQLKKLGIEATDEQLELHRISFKLYTLGQKNKIAIDQFKKVSDWFAILKRQNRTTKTYPSADFEAFLWSRWIVLCISQKKIGKSMFPSFISLNLPVIYKTLQLIAYLSKK